MTGTPSHTIPSPKPAPNRLHSLDGLRGIAALVVLLCHTFLLKPELAQAYLGPTLIERGTIWWWASFTPLHLFWAGTEAVYVFFVLSGYVLALPFLRGTDRGWVGYYPKRLLRLYLPVWGAFALAVMWVTLFPRRYPESASAWLQLHNSKLTSRTVRADLLLYPDPGYFNSPLWTLKYEVIFSLLLPVYIMVAKKLPRANILKAVVLMGVTVGFAHRQPSLLYFLPMFGLGVLMAMESERLSRLGKAIHELRYGRAVWGALALVALLLLNSYWTMFGFTTDFSKLWYLLRIALLLMMTGACLLLFVVVNCREGSRLSGRPARWLGSRSFSLYLVHEPIVVSTPLVLGSRGGFALSFLFAISASLVVAEIFHRLVERPSQRLGRSVERALQSRHPPPAMSRPLEQAQPPHSRTPSGVK